MYKCECGKEFISKTAYGGHKGSHSRGDAFKVGRKKLPVSYNCLNCKKIVPWTSTKTNKFCSIQCQGRYKWINETVPRIELGLCTSASVMTLKKYLIEKFGENCALCNIGAVWHNKDLVLQLDHIDGDSDNNYPVNIRLLCPNCHSQTDTFGSKGHGSRYKKISKRNEYLREYKRE